MSAFFSVLQYNYCLANYCPWHFLLCHHPSIFFPLVRIFKLISALISSSTVMTLVNNLFYNMSYKELAIILKSQS